MESRGEHPAGRPVPRGGRREFPPGCDDAPARYRGSDGFRFPSIPGSGEYAPRMGTASRHRVSPRESGSGHAREKYRIRQVAPWQPGPRRAPPGSDAPPLRGKSTGIPPGRAPLRGKPAQFPAPPDSRLRRKYMKSADRSAQKSLPGHPDLLLHEVCCSSTRGHPRFAVSVKDCIRGRKRVPPIAAPSVSPLIHHAPHRYRTLYELQEHRLRDGVSGGLFPGG